MKTGNLSEYAAHAGVSSAYVTKLKQAGRLVMVDVEGRQRVNFELSDRLVSNTSDVGRSRNGENARGRRAPSVPDAPFPETGATARQEGDRGGSPPPPAAPPPPEDPILLATRRAKAQQAVHDALTSELTYKKLSGQLVDREAAKRLVFDSFRSLRDQAFQAPARAAPHCMGVVDMREFERIFSAELRRSFDGWEEKMQARLAEIATK